MSSTVLPVATPGVATDGLVGDAVRRARDGLVAVHPADTECCARIRDELRDALTASTSSEHQRARAAGAAISTACAHLTVGAGEEAFLALDAALDRLRGP